MRVAIQQKTRWVLANIVYDTGENYKLASTFSRWNKVDLPLVAAAASPSSCGRCLRVYCIIKFRTRNNAIASPYQTLRELY